MALEVPQASLANIRSALAGLAEGGLTRVALQEQTGFQPRALAYALHAAELLDLATHEGDTWSLTAAGKRVIAARSKAKQAAAWTQVLETSKLVQRLAPGLFGSAPPDLSNIAERIRKYAGLADSTANRRAAAIRGWRDELTGFETVDALETLGPSWFEVENFKSIKHLKLDLHPLMVFVGPNGAGKTNILQALSIFLDILSEGVTEPIELHGGYDHLVRRAKRRCRYIRFALSSNVHSYRWSHSPLRMTVDIRLSGGEVAGDVKIDRQEFRLSSPRKKDLVVICEKDVVKRIDEGTVIDEPHGFLEWVNRWKTEGTRSLLLNILPRLLGIGPLLPVTRLRLDASALRSDAYLQGSRHGRLIGTAGEGLPLAVERLRKTSAVFKRVLTGLQEVYPRIEDIDTVHLLPGQVALRFKEKHIDEGLGQGNVSDGVMHALALLLVLEGAGDNTVLAIEEPENALHPWALRKLMLRAQSATRNAPLLLTTHSPTLIDAIQDPGALYIVENHGEMGTRVTAATEKERALSAILAESGQKLGEVWMDGTLGGIPESEA
ncbi:ATP-binding protein [Nannocystis sp. RBIL2]|uniref:AAA family ATPase n=1 Tax=Nannocystis sp. RBIL2 TaxID=2996788 RepID=UPI002271D6FF|nr:ATP-binding protein [Nannocystis sp. RBIL2]MCY1071362.1 ATP-binding protein [Nannocystis sp. RBIL2]